MTDDHSGHVLNDHLFAIAKLVTNMLFSVIADSFRNRETSGFLKAVWILLLIVIPFITLIVYLIANGSSMGERSARQAAGQGGPTLWPTWVGWLDYLTLEGRSSLSRCSRQWAASAAQMRPLTAPMMTSLRWCMPR